jgi:hypothetical protein
MLADLSDEDLLLALCVRPEQLDDPSAWCARLRELESRPDPTTVMEAEALMKDRDALRDTIHSSRSVSDGASEDDFLQLLGKLGTPAPLPR